MAHKRLLKGLVEGEVFGPDLSKGRSRVRVGSYDGRDGVTGGPALRVQVFHRLYARTTDSAQQVGGAVREVAESLAGGDGVENGSEQMGTKEMRRVAGQVSGVMAVVHMAAVSGSTRLLTYFRAREEKQGLWCLR
jgi:hypothetical protein